MAKREKKPSSTGSAVDPSAPTSPELQGAWKHFLVGDNRGARREAKAVLAGAAPEPAKREAHALLARTGIEKGALLTILAMAALLAAIIAVLAHRG